MRRRGPDRQRYSTELSGGCNPTRRICETMRPTTATLYVWFRAVNSRCGTARGTGGGGGTAPEVEHFQKVRTVPAAFVGKQNQGGRRPTCVWSDGPDWQLVGRRPAHRGTIFPQYSLRRELPHLGHWDRSTTTTSTAFLLPLGHLSPCFAISPDPYRYVASIGPRWRRRRSACV